MKQEQFERLHRTTWTQFEETLALLESSHRFRIRGRDKSVTGSGSPVKASAKQQASQDSDSATSETHINEFPQQYRLLCHHLAVVRDRGYSQQLFEQINDLVLRGHQILYRENGHVLYHCYRFIVAGFPQQIRRDSAFIWIALALFFGVGLLTFIFTWLFPSLIYNVMDPVAVTQLENMYNPSVDHIGRERQSDTDIMMFGYYIRNNIGIAFQTFASGLVYCIGSIFYMVYNGLVFGAISAHMIQLNYVETFFPFVIGHGSFELIAIAIAGAAGLKLGFSLISPGQYSRPKALRIAARESIRLMYGVFIMLVIAAFIEAFWSSSTQVALGIKYFVGAVFWALHIVYFYWAGRHGSE